MSVERFEKRPGSDVLQGIDNPTMLLVGDATPDTVTLPEALGGGVSPCLGATDGPCVCGVDHDARHYILRDGLRVAECARRNQFLWYRIVQS